MIDRRGVLSGLFAAGMVSAARAGDLTPETWLEGIGTTLRFRAKGLDPKAFTQASNSMFPTLPEGDAFLVDRRPRAVADLRGEVVALTHSAADWVKRVIGLPGDRIAFRNRRPIVNGVEAAWDFEGGPIRVAGGGAAELQIVRETLPGSRPYRISIDHSPVPGSVLGVDIPEFVVPADQLWLLGDCRDRSADSRYPGWGPIRSADVIGRVVYRLRPTPGWLVPPQTVPGMEGG